MAIATCQTSVLPNRARRGHTIDGHVHQDLALANLYNSAINVRTYNIEEPNCQRGSRSLVRGRYVQESRSEIGHGKHIKSRRPYAQTLENCVRKEHPAIGFDDGQADLEEEEASDFYCPVCQLGRI